MTGRQRIEAAFSRDGAPEIPVVIPYEEIFIRDHWRALTSCPWWYQDSPDIAHQIAWRRDCLAKAGSDWIGVRAFYAREERRHMAVEERSDGVFLINRRAGKEKRLEKPLVGGWSASGEIQSFRPIHVADTFGEVDRLIPDLPPVDPEEFGASGRADLARRILEECGGLFPICSVDSPLWACYGLWGFEGLMTMIAEKPEVVEHACRCFLARSLRSVKLAFLLGAAGIWIEECMTDMVSPEAFARLNVPFVRRIVEEVRALGMRSIYYFCGDPAGKWDLLLSADADALSLEESKKGFAIAIEDVVERVKGRCVVLGNLDAIGLLPNGTEERLRAEIRRQVQAGRRNGSRFIMSLGSPVTPGTPVERVRVYFDLAWQIGRTE